MRFCLYCTIMEYIGTLQDFKYRTFLGRFISQIGICSCPAYGADMTSVLKNLDAAVSAAEEYGPNQYAVFDSKLTSRFCAARPLPDICRLLWRKMKSRSATAPLPRTPGRYGPLATMPWRMRAVLIARLMEEGKEFESICIPVSPLLLDPGGLYRQGRGCQLPVSISQSGNLLRAG